MSYEYESKTTKEKKKILSPKLDVVFQILFGEVGSENITKDLLNTILDEKVDKVELNENIVLRREAPEEKMGIVDVLAKVNGKEYCNIEMQVIDQKNIIERALYYWARLYTRGVKEGDNYNKLKRTIMVLIADFELENLYDFGFHTKWILGNEETCNVLTDIFELHIIEIPKMYKEKAEGKDLKLKEWLHFLENPESKEVSNYMENNDNMKNAKEKLAVMSEDDRIKRLAELREKAILDEKEAAYTGYCRGMEKGLEDGRKEGIKEGREEGIKEGIEEGIEEGKVKGIKTATENIARNMKKEGFDIETIIKVTKLSKEEIEKL